MIKIIGIGEYEISKKEEDSIKTFALASCVGLVVYNTKDKVLGMAHIVLPKTREDEDEVAKNRVAYFADSAVPLLFQKIFGKYPTDRKTYKVSLFGGASSRSKNDIFCVGARNIEEVERILNENNIVYDKQNTGGHCSRTIEAYVCDGRVTIREQNIRI